MWMCFVFTVRCVFGFQFVGLIVDYTSLIFNSVELGFCFGVKFYLGKFNIEVLCGGIS